MKKIAFIISELSFGGAQIMLLELLKNIYNNYSIKLFVIHNELNNDLESEFEKLKIEIEYIGVKTTDSMLVKIKKFLKFRRDLNCFKPDLIHNHLVETYSFLYSLLSNTKMIFTIHSWPDRIINKKRNKGFINKLIDKKLIVFVGCANCVSNRIEYIIKNDNIIVKTIYNPLDLKMFEKYKQQDKKNNNEFTFITVGRLSQIKNQELLLKAFEKIQKKHKCKLNIIGYGNLEDYLKAISRDLNIDQKVSFLGNIPNNEVHNSIFSSDCFVLTSKSECCPIVLLEAMALKTPIITTDVGGTAEITKGASILIRNDNENDLINAMEKIITSEQIRNELIKKSEKQIKKFEVSKIIKEYCDLYNELLHRKECKKSE